MKKPAIPGTEPTKKNIGAIVENVEIITGRRGVKITPLASNASLAETIAKVNELCELLQG